MECGVNSANVFDIVERLERDNIASKQQIIALKQQIIALQQQTGRDISVLKRKVNKLEKVWTALDKRETAVCYDKLIGKELKDAVMPALRTNAELQPYGWFQTTRNFCDFANDYPDVVQGITLPGGLGKENFSDISSLLLEEKKEGNIEVHEGFCRDTRAGIKDFLTRAKDLVPEVCHDYLVANKGACERAMNADKKRAVMAELDRARAAGVAQTKYTLLAVYKVPRAATEEDLFEAFASFPGLTMVNINRRSSAKVSQVAFFDEEGANQAISMAVSAEGLRITYTEEDGTQATESLFVRQWRYDYVRNSLSSTTSSPRTRNSRSPLSPL